MSGSVTEIMSVTQHLNENSSYNRNNNKDTIFNTDHQLPILWGSGEFDVHDVLKTHYRYQQWWYL